MAKTQNLNSIIKLDQGSKALEIKTSNQLLATFKNVVINNEEETKFIAELAMLCNLRNEDYEYDYKPFVDDWLNVLAKNGYTGTQAIEMVQLAQTTLPKYGYTKLTLPDIIVNWEKRQEALGNIRYSDFFKMFEKIALDNFSVLNQAAIELTGFDFVTGPKAKEFYKYLEQLKDSIEAERTAVEHNNIELNYTGLIKYKKFQELSEEAERYINEIKLSVYEIILSDIDSYINRKTIWAMSPTARLTTERNNLKNAIEQYDKKKGIKK